MKLTHTDSTVTHIHMHIPYYLLAPTHAYPIHAPTRVIHASHAFAYYACDSVIARGKVSNFMGDFRIITLFHMVVFT